MDRIGHRNEGAGRRVGCRMDPQLDYAPSECTLKGYDHHFKTYFIRNCPTLFSTRTRAIIRSIISSRYRFSIDFDGSIPSSGITIPMMHAYAFPNLIFASTSQRQDHENRIL